jgi:8-oxo-dGTP pyrophosphatase MutT (NUDIX family)
MTSPQKACPVVVRQNQDRFEILAFRHPLAGCQLVKGTIEPGEDAGRAALRELCEESGICDATLDPSDSFLGTIQLAGSGQEWHLFLCSTGTLTDSWTHHTEDDGGHNFEFFWHPMDQPLDDEWHPDFEQAINFIRRNIQR